MRIALVALVACGGPPPAPVSPPAMIVLPARHVPPEPITFVERNAAGVENVLTWQPGFKMSSPRHGTWEDVGLFAYARRTTRLTVDGVAVGWLDPGARVAVVATDGKSTDVMTFPWPGRTTPIRATVAATDLGATKLPLAASAVTHPRRTVKHGQTLSRTDGKPLGYTFCGDVEVIDETDTGFHVIQREDGVALEGLLDKRASWQEGACPGLVVVEDGTGKRLRYHDRFRAYREPGLPDGVVAAGAITGPTFAQLIDKRATIWWLSARDDGSTTCDGWRLSPPAKGDSDADIVHTSTLDGGGKVITHYGVRFTNEPASTIGLLGPYSESFDRNGNSTGAIAYGCGNDFQVIESEPGVLLMHEHPPYDGSKIVGYERADTERWYTDKARCERDAEAKRTKVAIGTSLHSGC